MKTADELLNMLGAPVLFDEMEVSALAQYASEVPIGGIIADIGTGYGASALLFSLNAPEATVYTCDPYLPGDGEGTGVTDRFTSWSNIVTALQQVGSRKTSLELRHATSEELAVEMFDHRLVVDLVLIDGNHQYNVVRRDVELWIHLLRTGGIILLHDSRQPENPGDMGKAIPGPVKAARELAGHPFVRNVGNVHSLTAWRKVA